MKNSNDTANLNTNKYTNYNIIEIYINRLTTTTQIFMTMDYLLMMSEKYPYFRKRKKHLDSGSMYFGNIFRVICLPKICTKT